MNKLFLSLMLALIVPAFPGISHATVSNSTNQVIYTGDGVTTVFPFSFNVYNSASENDLVVQKENTATGAITTLALNNLTSGYTVTLNNAIPSAGSITLSAGPLPIGTNLSILRQLPLTQLVSESDNSATSASVRNNVYDRQMMVSQQLNSLISLAVLQNPFSSTQITLPAPLSGYSLGWDTNGNLTNIFFGGTGSTIPVPIPNSYLSSLTTASTVSGASLFNLSSTPSAAGILPVANLPTGTSANQIVKLDGSAKIPLVLNSSGVPIQMVNVQDGAFHSGLTTIPFDDTIPQNTEGDQYLSLSITPNNASNILKIDVVLNVTFTSINAVAALFQDSLPNALCAQATNDYNQTNEGVTKITFTYFMTAGTTSPTTFKVRAGPTGGLTLYVNALNGGRILGGVNYSSMTITEIKA